MIFGTKTFNHDLWNFDDIETEEGEVRLYKTPSGKFPSMTSILHILDDGGLQTWIDRVGEDEAKRIAEEAAIRGDVLHKLSEDYLLNRFDKKKQTGQGGILFNKAKNYLDEIETVHGVEVPVYSTKLKYAGRVDGIVQHESNIIILDHKNSRREVDLTKDYDRKKIFKYMMQCTGYAVALFEMKKIVATHGMLLISNMQTISTKKIKFEIAPLISEFKLLVDAYYGKCDIKQSMFFKL